MADIEPPVSSVTRKRARSGVGYSVDDVLLHESRTRRVLLRPWYIPHNTQAHGLSVKLLVQTKDPDGFWVEEQALNLDELATPRLRRALEEHSAVARSGQDGDILLIRGAAVATASEVEPSELVGAVVALLARPDVLAHFSRQDLSREILNALQASIRLQELRLAIGELRYMLDTGVSDEQSYQEWCTRHSWAFGNAHTQSDDIRRVTRTDEVDLLLPRVLTGFRDIIELKRPDAPVLARDASRGTLYWSRDAAQAIGQCHQYMDNLHTDAERGLRGRPEIVAYHPRATVVIGRSTDWPADTYRAFAGLNQRLAGVTLMTYDQLLAQGDELMRLFTEESVDVDPDDIPF